MNTTPPLFSVGYNEDGVILYRTDEHGKPLMLALMDTTAAIRYAGDLCDVAEHLMQAAERFAAHRALVADGDDALNVDE